MYLKSLELQGFKSFPDKTVLSFGRGVTAIVGPNGSGKSNIADAIRWVLGEQSSKTLRGAKMEDVIFGGTQNRGPVGYAEVSLILDNADGTLPVDAVEIMVTRRYYRSGESEYYINRTTVRLRDIHELFMDTGLGRDGYSIIGQGRIDDILSVKSSDRREIFEEAAGISKFRYRKEESERKLLNTEANLLRINDKISELELSVEPLRDQSERASQYLIMRDELRVREVSVWMDSLKKLNDSSAEVIENYKNISDQLESEKAELERLYADSELLTEKIRDIDLQIESQRARLEEGESGYAESESRLAVLKTSLSNMTENIGRIERESEEQSGRAKNLDDQIEESGRRASEIKDEIEKIDGALLDLDLQSRQLLSSDTELGERLDALGARELSEENIISESALKLRSAEAAEEELLLRQAALTADKAVRTAAITEIRTDADHISGLLDEKRDHTEALGNVIAGYELRLNNRRRRLAEAEKANTDLKMEYNALENRVRLLADMERDYEGFSNAVKIVMRESEKGNIRGVHGPLSKLIRTEDAHTLAIEIALGFGLQNIVVDSENDAKAAIEMLKRRDAGRSTFLPLSAIRGRVMTEDLSGERGFIGIASELVETEPKYIEILRNALGRTAVAEDMDTAIAMARKYGYRFRIVTLDGQIINSGGSMTGGSSGRNTGILSRANELEQLTRTAKDKAGLLKESDLALSELKRENTEAEYKVEAAKNEQRAAEDMLLKLEGEFAAVNSRALEAERAYRSLAAELEEIERRLAGLKETEAELRGKIEVHSAQRDLVRKEAAEIKDGRAELIDRRGSLTGKSSEYREKKSGLQGEAQSTLKNMEELTKLKEHFSSDMERRADQIRDYRDRCDELKTEIDGASKAAADIKAANLKIRETVSGLTKNRMDVEADRISKDRSGKEKNTLILNLQHEQGRLEQKKTEAEMLEKQLVDKLWDTYELTRTTAAVVARGVESATAENKRITELRRGMTRLGDVNIGAIEEYKRVFERYSYLTEQRNDVEKSKDELVEIIERITGQMTAIFSDRFRDINESFSQTFVEIFGGGQARLELEDERDILNCGIEIRVQPPGKSLKTITLLSGGEKAFVAIALYFSILKVRPTPFCVLDEIEAALDDVNVDRYAKYLRRLCHTTQFILITHRRGTMEESDVLYGVTMQTSGISKIITLNINEAESQLGISLK